MIGLNKYKTKRKLSCLGYSSNYAASQNSQGMENKKDINQDMKRTIEIAKLNVITLSENKKKGHENRNSKSSKPVQSGNPTIKRKKRQNCQRRLFGYL